MKKTAIFAAIIAIAVGLMIYDFKRSEKREGFFPAQWDPKLGIHVT